MTRSLLIAGRSARPRWPPPHAPSRGGHRQRRVRRHRPRPEDQRLSAQTLLEVEVDITDQHPQAITDQLITDADLVVTLGRDAQVHPADGTLVVNWDTDEPSERGIDGIERMRLVRDDIAARVDQLIDQLGAPTSSDPDAG